MKMVSRYLKFNKFARFLVVFLIFSTFIVLLGKILVPQATLKITNYCEEINSTELYCTFECSFSTNCPENFMGRIIVVHSGWVAIFDKKFEMKCNQNNTVEIQLPKRGYSYILRGAFYDENEYGISKNVLIC
jgi:predicted PurR-regulated permease PerM